MRWRAEKFSGWGGFPPYVSAAKKRAKAEKQMAALRRKGEQLDPVAITGRTIARTFWGKAWCTHLESHSDFSNRLPRGRSYVRQGSVCDLKIETGRVSARVVGTHLYKVIISIKKLPGPRWAAIKSTCAGGIDSLIELLQGRLSSGVMKIITDRENGLFPRPSEIEMNCSCPDWATMCKHVAATLYGVGARLDDRPELLFVLRGVDKEDLVSERAISRLVAGEKPGVKETAGEPGAKTTKSGRLSMGIATGKPGRGAMTPVEGRKKLVGNAEASATAGPAGESPKIHEIPETDLANVFGVEIAPAGRKKRRTKRS
jgi:uncharacterized Zn finger protein